MQITVAILARNRQLRNSASKKTPHSINISWIAFDYCIVEIGYKFKLFITDKYHLLKLIQTFYTFPRSTNMLPQYQLINAEI